MWSIINIETHNLCNLGCKHCPYTSMTRPKESLPMDLFEKIVDDTVNCGIRLVNLNIYGEPLLDTLIFDRIKYCKDKGLEVQFTTNGTLLSDDIITRILYSKIDRLYISFDGSTKEVYESIRVGADFHKTKEGIERLLERKGKLPEVVIVTVLQEEKTQAIPRNIWKGQIDGIQYWPIDNRRKLGLSKEGRIKKSLPCSRIFRELNILSSGEVALCCLDYDGRQLIGDLKLSSIKEVWDSTYFRTIRRLHLKGDKQLVNLCKDCKRASSEKLSWIRLLWKL